MAIRKTVETHLLGLYPTRHQHTFRVYEHEMQSVHTASSSVTGEQQGAPVGSDLGMKH